MIRYTLENAKISSFRELIKEGYDVLTAHNAQNALRNVEKYSLDIILLDLSLPGISGFDFLKKIKENELTKNIPIVILTTSGHDKDIDLAYNMGANSYIVKPEDTVEFIIKLNEINSYWSITSEIPKIATPI